MLAQVSVGNRETALLQLEEIALMRDRLSSHFMGVLAFEVEKNEEKAIQWWKKGTESCMKK
jgi:hypothetical protein